MPRDHFRKLKKFLRMLGRSRRLLTDGCLTLFIRSETLIEEESPVAATRRYIRGELSSLLYPSISPDRQGIISLCRVKRDDAFDFTR